MKPLFMRLKAFGPFAGEADVSFDRVFDGGLFLIHGRTGAGKTSLLDGLCFSLFGRPSSEEREKDLRGLRSDLAQAQDMTETELVFAIGKDVYRVHRIPTQTTPKKRGEGFTEHKGSAELYRLEGSIDEVRSRVEATKPAPAPDLTKLNWLPLAGKVEAVDVAIENLLGMNERQFRQVVVLPQGKFREFLSSTSSDRQEILEKLFQTDRFSRLQQYVSKKSRDAGEAWRRAGEHLQGKLESMGLSSVDEIPVRKTALLERSVEATEKLATAQLKAEALAHEFNQAKEFELSRNRLRALTDEAAVLQGRNRQIAEFEKSLNLARTWAPYFQLEIELDAASRKKTDVERRKDDAAKELEEAHRRSSAARAQHDALTSKKPSLDEMSEERARLRELVPLLQDIAKTRQQLEAERRVTATSRAVIEKLTRENAALQSEQVDRLRLLFTLDEDLRSKESRQLEIEDRKLKELELTFHHSEAARLARLLSAGQPCPVCGSSSHPKPAGGGDSSLTAEAIARSKKIFEALNVEITQARSKRSSRLEPLPHEFKTPARAAVENPESSHALFMTTFEIFERTKGLVTQNQHSIEIGKTEVRKSDEAVAASLATIEQKLAVVPEVDRSLDVVMKRGLELRTEQEKRTAELKAIDELRLKSDGDSARLQGTIHALADEERRLNIDHARLREELSVLENSLTKNGSERPVRRFDPGELSRLESEIDRHRLALTKNQAAMHEIQTSIERMGPARSTEAIAAELTAANESRSETEKLTARLHVETEQLAKLENETTVGKEKLERFKSEAERAARMSALLTGDRAQNKLLVPLSRFVLQSRFEEVLEQANRRLARMSRGQFQLRRPALSRNLRDSQGLELSVEDTVVGKERHAGSLSGGESFMAALSLALGLADVVQMDLGGVKLDSVLIDEGFGTLDSESLDLALKTLTDLQAGGRIVGVISHVQELKNQIHHRLEVTKSAGGSRAEWNGDAIGVSRSVATREN